MDEQWVEPERYWCRQITSGRCRVHAYQIRYMVGGIGRRHPARNAYNGWRDLSVTYYTPLSVIDVLDNGGA